MKYSNIKIFIAEDCNIKCERYREKLKYKQRYIFYRHSGRKNV